jgi:hypothetical protein
MKLVQVTQDHIDRGQRCQALCCPVALAVSDAFGALSSASTAFITTQLSRDGEVQAVVFNSPKSVRDFILRYDGGGNVEPFCFPLDVCSPLDVS